MGLQSKEQGDRNNGRFSCSAIKRCLCYLEGTWNGRHSKEDLNSTLQMRENKRRRILVELALCLVTIDLPGDFLASWNQGLIITFDDVLINSQQRTHDVVDAQTKEVGEKNINLLCT